MNGKIIKKWERNLTLKHCISKVRLFGGPRAQEPILKRNLVLRISFSL